MKKLMFAAVLCASVLAYAQEAAPDAAAKDDKAALVAKRNAFQAKLLGMSAEDYAKLTPAERKAKMKEFRAKQQEEQAKLVGMPVEEFAKLTPAERREKVKAARKAAGKPAKAKKGKKAKKVEAPAAAPAEAAK